MYAVIEVSGKQFRVAKGDTFLVDQAKGATSVDARVLLVVDGTNVVTDRAKLDKASVSLTADGQVRERLARTMKFKPKQGRTSKRIMGHRRTRTRVTVGDISLAATGR